LKPDLLPAVTILQSQWPTLSDLDRSIAITPVLAAGTSGRQLAAALGCSEALIRLLKQLAKASPEDRRQLRAGLISTREVVRRIKGGLELKARKEHEAKKLANLGATERGAKRVMRWFRDEGISCPYAEQILIEARRKLAEAEMSGALPKEKAPARLKVGDIIHLCGRVVPAFSDAFSFVEHFARWLALWAFHVMPDIQVRDGALDIALDQLSAR